MGALSLCLCLDVPQLDPSKGRRGGAPLILFSGANLWHLRLFIHGLLYLLVVLKYSTEDVFDAGSCRCTRPMRLLPIRKSIILPRIAQPEL